MELVRACPEETWTAILNVRETRPLLSREEFAGVLCETMPDLKLAKAMALFLLDWGLDDAAIYADWLPQATCCWRNLERLCNKTIYSGLQHFETLLRRICKVYQAPPGPPHVMIKLGTKPVSFVAKRTPAASAWLRIITVSATLLAMLLELVDDEEEALANISRSRRQHVGMNGFCMYQNSCTVNKDLHDMCIEMEAESLRFTTFISQYSESYSDKIGYAETPEDYTLLTSLQATVQAWMMKCSHVRKL